MKKDLSVYYHIWTPTESKLWRLLVDEQLKRIYRSGLPNHADIYCGINSANYEEIRSFVRLYDWINILEAGSDNDQFEGFTMKYLYEECVSRPSLKAVCYIHTKGIRHLETCVPASFKAINSWRHFLEWGVIDRWRDGLQRLADHDVAGINFRTVPWAHFSGNFWWSTARYGRRLPPPREFVIQPHELPNVDALSLRRLSYERWLFVADPKPFSFATYPFRAGGKELSIWNLYEEDIEPYYREASL